MAVASSAGVAIAGLVPWLAASRPQPTAGFVALKHQIELSDRSKNLWIYEGIKGICCASENTSLPHRKIAPLGFGP
jgi:hypothetical protein